MRPGQPRAGPSAPPHPCNAGGVPPPWGRQPPTSVMRRDQPGADLSDSQSSSPASVISQSQAFQNTVGARMDDVTLVTRSLIAVTSGNWKRVTP